MSKKLSEMSLEELWQLFPIQLTPHQEIWESNYVEMKEQLQKILNISEKIRIYHIGSTAIPGICAKPIVDILVELDPSIDMTAIADTLQAHGFIQMSKEEKRISLNYGYTPEGFATKVYHIHLRFYGDKRELYFRNYLLEFSEIAKEYEALKLELWKRYEYNRDAYTNAKTEFIDRITELAMKRYRENA